MLSDRLDVLRSAFQGEILLPGDSDYEPARQVWKPGVDRRPAVIARCARVADVVAAVRFAREAGLPVCVRGGGHSFAGYGVWDGALMIDLSPMKAVRVDPERLVAVVQPGVTWGELDTATQEHGLATTGGDSPATGVVGMTLGGGVGWLHRLCGLSCDNVLSAQVVTADGEVLRAADDEHPELFWALRGGGGNFGIVTSLRLRLHRVGALTTGFLVHPVERAGEVLRFYQEFSEAAPDELRLSAMVLSSFPAPFLPDEVRDRPVLVITPAYFGTPEDADRVTRPLREYGSPATDLFMPADYLFLQQQVAQAMPAGLSHHSKGEVLEHVGDGLVDALAAGLVDAPAGFASIGLTQLGGAIRRVAGHQTPFPFRQAGHLLNISRMWDAEQPPDPHVGWVERLWDAVRSGSAGGEYVNHLGDEGDQRVREAYGANYPRLAAIKATYDPENVFRVNQNIKPEPASRT